MCAQTEQDPLMFGSAPRVGGMAFPPSLQTVVRLNLEKPSKTKSQIISVISFRSAARLFVLSSLSPKSNHLHPCLNFRGFF